MTVTTFTSREFNQNLARAKRAAKSGPVIVTDRGRPAHVLLGIDDYRRLAGKPRNLAEALSMARLADIDFEPARVRIDSPAADLS